MTEKEILAILTIAQLRQLSPADKTWLLTQGVPADELTRAQGRLKSLLPDATEQMAAALKDTSEPRRKAESELEFAISHKLDVIAVTEARYPQRLKQCADAPPVVFFDGYGELNPAHVISIVGTRHSTPYGQDFTRRLVNDLAQACPDVQIVSGLAYGIDIHAHRAAVDAGLSTVAVLAHGLDRLYPPTHRGTADKMKEKGGLLTENFTGTVPDRLHFLTRNRLVAGMADAVVVVESAHHGGALVTAKLAGGYGRTLAAVPGRAGDEYSEGCNNLIRSGKAKLITSAADLLSCLGWQNESLKAEARKAGVERTLFPELDDAEQQIVNQLDKNGDMQLNTLAAILQKPAGQLSATLFTLEMKGVLRPLAGGMYHLIK